jgi:hypothetical protein
LRCRSLFLREEYEQGQKKWKSTKKGEERRKGKIRVKKEKHERGRVKYG